MEKILKILLVFFVIIIVVISAISGIFQTQISDIIEELEEEPFIVKIFANTTEGNPPLNIQFDAATWNYEGKLNYSWDFGDGEISTEVSPSHIYFLNKTYVCSVIVSDNNGNKGNDSIIINSILNRPPTVTILINNQRPRREYKVGLPKIADNKNGLWLQRLKNIIPKTYREAKGPITVLAQVDDPEGDDIVSYKWELKPPNQITITGDDKTPIYTYYGQNVTFSLLDTYVVGKYNLKLNVTDSAGKSRSTALDFQIQPSIIETKIGSLMWIITTLFLDTIYEQFMSEDQQHMVSDPIWLFFGSIDKIVTKIISNLPSSLQEIGYSLWALVVSFIEVKFPRPVPKANLLSTFDDNSFNHSSTVVTNGSVPIEVSKTNLITVKNNDSENTAVDVFVTLQVKGNPKYNDKGLDETLEKEQFEVTMTAGGMTKKLYFNGTYSKGFKIGDLAPGDSFTGEITVKLLTAGENTFDDNNAYNCTMFVYQEGANYPLHYKPPDPVPFEVKT